MADGFGVGFFFEVLWLLVYLVFEILVFLPLTPSKGGYLFCRNCVDENCGFSCHFACVRRLMYGFFLFLKKPVLLSAFSADKKPERSAVQKPPTRQLADNALINFEGMNERIN
jgi:hypothetical protein